LARQWLTESGCTVLPALNEALVTLVRQLLEATWRKDCRSKGKRPTERSPRAVTL